MENHRNLIIGVIVVLLAAGAVCWYRCYYMMDDKQQNVKVQDYNEKGQNSSPKYARYQSDSSAS